MKASLRRAGPADLAAVWPAVSAARLFATPYDLEYFARVVPWGVQVTPGGEAVVLERWREHLDILAMRGVWCAERRVPAIVGQVRAIAADLGFGRVLSPLVSEGAAEAYRRAGMMRVERIVSLRLDGPPRDVRSVAPPPGVVLAEGGRDDLDALLGADEECFDGFWHYDRASLERYLSVERAGLALREGQVIGYTLCTVHAGVGTLGRLAVVPGERGRGVGSALLSDALAHMGREGATSVSLCTQESNDGSRRMYARAGMRESPARVVFLAVRA
ncbi:MAG: hypothetical protein C0418_02725 [Coriobacteriaceae bacterium]|nr:hypothetical protein [Coriobacteriaceae bacterium]